MKKHFTHIDINGNMHMVDTGKKDETERVAIAQAVVALNADTFKLFAESALPKGDALACAKIGAIMAAKKTGELIPLCHPLPLSQVEIKFEICEERSEIRILAETRCKGRTGVEMEAIIAAQTAAAIIYDMCKAVQRDIVISDIRLLYKNGGRSGEFCTAGWKND